MKPWREACETALRDFSRADALRFWKTGHTVDGAQVPIFDYRFEHTLASVATARWLGPQVGADLEILECAAWLHDCRKILQDPRPRDHHALEGAEAVPGILEGTDFPAGKIPAVQHAIRLHVGLRLARRLEPLEAACLWDADKLSKLGAASLVHFGAISGAFQPITTAEVLRRGLAWLELGAGIVESMNTGPAQAEAERRLEFLRRHYAQLQRELAHPMEACGP